MTIKILQVINNTVTNLTAKNISIFRTIVNGTTVNDWYPAKNIKVWKDPNEDGVGFWDLAYPNLPLILTTPSVSGTGRLGTSYSLSDSTPWVEDGYVKVQTTTYQWARSLTSGGPYTDVTGATSATYTIQQQDVDYYFICKVTGTNAKGSTVINSTESYKAYDPNFTFQFGKKLGFNSKSAIMFDEQPGGGFPNSLFNLGRILGMFLGSWKVFDINYKSDESKLRIYYRFYRASETTRPTSPTGEIEVVLTSGSQIAEVYIPNPVSPIYVESYSAYILDIFTLLQSYESLLIRNITNKQFSNGTVTLTTSSTHPFSVGSSVWVTDVDSRFNGIKSVTAATSTTFQYSNPITSSITNKSLTSNVVTLTTSTAHSFNVGETVSITGVDAVFNGTYVITAVPTTTTFRYSRVNANITSTTSGGTATLTNVPSSSVSSPAKATWSLSAGYKFTVPMRDTGSVSMSIESGSPTPSRSTGWIDVTSINNYQDRTLQFTTDQISSPFLSINLALNKTNMFWPSDVTINEPGYINSSSASLSWGGSNANYYSVSVVRSDNGALIYSQNLTVNSVSSISGLVQGVNYTITVRPNSRSDGLGQFGTSITKSYLHATTPNAPTNVSGSPGNGQVSLTWTAPASNGSAIEVYKVRYSSNGGLTWTTVSTGSTANAYTVTGLTNGTSYIFQVLANNAKGDSLWSASSASITPEIIPTKVVATSSPSTIETSITGDSKTSTITAQLKDDSNNNVAKSGVVITFTLSGTAGGSISANTATTDSTGKASITYTSGTAGNATGGTTVVATITPSATGLTGTATSVTVNLRSAFSFTLSASGTTKGVLFTKSTNDSNYTWSAATGSPSVGYLESGDSYANNSFDIIVPVLRNNPPGRPQVTVNSTAKTANCDMSINGVTVYDLNRSTSVTLTAKRSGFNDGSATGTATSALTFTRTFLWQFATASDNFTTWRTDWPSAFVVNGVQTWNEQTLKWTGTPNSRKIRCRVTTNVTGVFADPSNTSVPSQDVRFTSNEPTIP